MFLPHATYTPSQGPGKCHRITEAAQNPESHQLNQVQLWMRLFGYSSLSTAAWVELLLAWETKETGFLPHLHLTYSGRTGIGHSSSNGENGRHKGVISPWQFWNWAGKCCIFLIRSQGLGSLSMVLPYLLGSWFHPLGDPHYFIFWWKKARALQLISFLGLLPTNRILGAQRLYFVPSLSLSAPACHISAFFFFLTLGLWSILLVSTSLVKSHTTHRSLK